MQYKGTDMNDVFRLFLEHIEESSKKPPSAETRRRILTFIKNCARKHNGFFHIARMSGRTVGYLVGTLRKSPAVPTCDHAEVIELYVTRSFRKQRIGGRLLNRFFAWSKKKGIRRITIEAETADRSAIGFWSRHGFARTWIVMLRTIS